MNTRIFVNMQVANLPKSKAFFEKLGWNINPQFSNDDSACLVISENIFAMLHTSKGIERFIPKGKSVTDAKKQFEVMLAVSVENKDRVNDMYAKAIAEGATECRPMEDNGFMMLRSFNDLDGHIWEIFWMDPAGMNG